MPTVALPVTAGTTRAAGLHPDHRTNEHAATPFAALLDTGVSPKVPARPTTRSDRPQGSDKSSRVDSSGQPQERLTASKDTKPAAAESKGGAKTKGEANNKGEAKSNEEAKTTAEASCTQEAELEVKNVDEVIDALTEAGAGEPEKSEQAEGDAAALELPPVVDIFSTATPADANAPVTATAPVVTNPAVPVPVQPSLPGLVVTTDAPEAAESGEAIEVVAIAAEKTADVIAPEHPEQRPAIASKVGPKPEIPAETTAKAGVPVSTDEPETTAVNKDETAALPGKTDAALQPPQQQQVEGEKPAGHDKPAAEKPTLDTATSDKAMASASLHQSDASGAAKHADISVQANTTLPAASIAAPPQTVSPAQAPAVAVAAVPISGLAVEIVTQAKEGKNRFEIRLDPPELGRIDVRLDVDGQGNVTSRLVVERQDTLDLLRRESSALERALNDAGLKTGNDGLQFSLRDQGFNGDTQRDGSNGRMARVVVPTDAGVAPDPSTYRLPRLGGLDIRV